MKTLNERHHLAHYSVLRQVCDEAPHLAPLVVHACREKLVSRHDDSMLRVLKRHFRRFDIGDGGWRFLTRFARSLVPQADYQIAGSLMHALADLLKLHLTWQATQALPNDFLQVANAYWGPDKQGRIDLTRLLAVSNVQTMRAAVRQFEEFTTSPQVRQQRLAFLREELAPVVDWANAAIGETQRIPGNAGWRWMLRAARAWEEREAAHSLRHSVRWPAALGAVQVGIFLAQEITSSFDLWEEGHAMRHCVANYAFDCARGTKVVFSLRNRNGARVATGVGTISGTPPRLQFWAMRGWANASVHHRAPRHALDTAFMRVDKRLQSVASACALSAPTQTCQVDSPTTKASEGSLPVALEVKSLMDWLARLAEESPERVAPVRLAQAVNRLRTDVLRPALAPDVRYTSDNFSQVFEGVEAVCGFLDQLFRRVFDAGAAASHGAELVTFERAEGASVTAVAVFHGVANASLEQQPQSVLCCDFTEGLVARIHATKLLGHHRLARTGIYPGANRQWLCASLENA